MHSEIKNLCKNYLESSDIKMYHGEFKCADWAGLEQ
jgi:hypothetical protein